MAGLAVVAADIATVAALAGVTAANVVVADRVSGTGVHQITRVAPLAAGPKKELTPAGNLMLQGRCRVEDSVPAKEI